MDELYEILLAEDLRDILKEFPEGLRRWQIADEVRKRNEAGELPLPPVYQIALKLKNTDAQDQLLRGALYVAQEEFNVERMENTGSDSVYRIKPVLQALAEI